MLFNLQEWNGKRHVSTVRWQIPYQLAKGLKKQVVIDKKYPKGTYFKIVKNGNIVTKPSSSSTCVGV